MSGEDETTQLPASLQKFFKVTLGMEWPEGSEGGLRAMSGAWSDFAEELETAAAEVLVSAQGIDQAMDGVTATKAVDFLRKDLHDALTQLQDQAHEFAKMAKNAAADIQKTKIMLIAMAAMALATVISLLASLFGAFLVPSVIAAARVGLGALLKELLANIARLTAREIGQAAVQLAKDLAKYAALGAGTMGGLDLGIQGIQDWTGDRDGIDWQSVGGSAAGGAIGGAAFGGVRSAGRGVGNLIGKETKDHLGPGMRALGHLGYAGAQGGAVAASNPAINKALGGHGGAFDGILGAMGPHGGGARGGHFGGEYTGGPSGGGVHAPDLHPDFGPGEGGDRSGGFDGGHDFDGHATGDQHGTGGGHDFGGDGTFDGTGGDRGFGDQRGFDGERGAGHGFDGEQSGTGEPSTGQTPASFIPTPNGHTAYGQGNSSHSETRPTARSGGQTDTRPTTHSTGPGRTDSRPQVTSQEDHREGRSGGTGTGSHRNGTGRPEVSHDRGDASNAHLDQHPGHTNTQHSPETTAPQRTTGDNGSTIVDNRTRGRDGSSTHTNTNPAEPGAQHGGSSSTTHADSGPATHASPSAQHGDSSSAALQHADTSPDATTHASPPAHHGDSSSAASQHADTSPGAETSPTSHASPPAQHGDPSSAVSRHVDTSPDAETSPTSHASPPAQHGDSSSAALQHADKSPDAETSRASHASPPAHHGGSSSSASQHTNTSPEAETSSTSHASPPAQHSVSSSPDAHTDTPSSTHEGSDPATHAEQHSSPPPPHSAESGETSHANISPANTHVTPTATDGGPATAHTNSAPGDQGTSRGDGQTTTRPAPTDTTTRPAAQPTVTRPITQSGGQPSTSPVDSSRPATLDTRSSVPSSAITGDSSRPSAPPPVESSRPAASVGESARPAPSSEPTRPATSIEDARAATPPPTDPARPATSAAGSTRPSTPPPVESSRPVTNSAEPTRPATSTGEARPSTPPPADSARPATSTGGSSRPSTPPPTDSTRPAGSTAESPRPAPEPTRPAGSTERSSTPSTAGNQPTTDTRPAQGSQTGTSLDGSKPTESPSRPQTSTQQPERTSDTRPSRNGLPVVPPNSLANGTTTHTTATAPERAGKSSQQTSSGVVPLTHVPETESRTGRRSGDDDPNRRNPPNNDRDPSGPPPPRSAAERIDSYRHPADATERQLHSRLNWYWDTSGGASDTAPPRREYAPSDHVLIRQDEHTLVGLTPFMAMKWQKDHGLADAAKPDQTENVHKFLYPSNDAPRRIYDIDDVGQFRRDVASEAGKRHIEHHEQWTSAVHDLADWITEHYPPDRFSYVGLGRSPAPVMAALQAQGHHAVSVPLSKFRPGPADENSILKPVFDGDPSLTPEQREMLGAHFAEFLSGLPRDRNLLVIDYTESGKSLLAAQDYLQHQLDGLPGPKVEVHGLALHQQLEGERLRRTVDSITGDSHSAPRRWYEWMFDGNRAAQREQFRDRFRLVSLDEDGPLGENGKAFSELVKGQRFDDFAEYGSFKLQETTPEQFPDVRPRREHPAGDPTAYDALKESIGARDDDTFYDARSTFSEDEFHDARSTFEDDGSGRPDGDGGEPRQEGTGRDSGASDHSRDLHGDSAQERRTRDHGESRDLHGIDHGEAREDASWDSGEPSRGEVQDQPSRGGGAPDHGGREHSGDSGNSHHDEGREPHGAPGRGSARGQAPRDGGDPGRFGAEEQPSRDGGDRHRDDAREPHDAPERGDAQEQAHRGGDAQHQPSRDGGAPHHDDAREPHDAPEHGGSRESHGSAHRDGAQEQAPRDGGDPSRVGAEEQPSRDSGDSHHDGAQHQPSRHGENPHHDGTQEPHRTPEQDNAHDGTQEPHGTPTHDGPRAPHTPEHDPAHDGTREPHDPAHDGTQEPHGTSEHDGPGAPHTPNPTPPKPDPAQLAREARLARPKVEGDIDGTRIREAAAELIHDDPRLRKDETALTDLVDRAYSDPNLKKNFHTALDGGQREHLGVRGGPHVTVELVGLRKTGDETPGKTDFTTETSRVPEKRTVSTERSPLTTEGPSIRIPALFVNIQAKLSGLVNARGSSLSAETSHGRKTKLTETNVDSRTGDHSATYKITVHSPGRWPWSGSTPRFAYVDVPLKLAWPESKADKLPEETLPWHGNDRIEHARFTGLGDVYRHVERQVGFKANDPETGEFRTWLDSLDHNLFGKVEQRTFRFAGHSRPTTVSVGIGHAAKSFTDGRTEGSVERSHEATGKITVTQSQTRKRGGGGQIVAGDIIGPTGGSAGPTGSRTAATKTEATTVDEHGRTTERSYEGPLDKHHVELTYLVRTDKGSHAKTGPADEVPGTATVWTRPDAPDSGTASPEVRHAADRVDAEYSLPKLTADDIAGRTMSRLSLLGHVPGKELPRLTERLRTFLQDHARDIARGGARFPLSSLYPGAPDVFVHGDLNTGNGVALHGEKGGGGKLSLSHEDTTTTTRTTETSAGITGSGYGHGNYGYSGVTGEWSRGRSETEKHGSGHEQAFPDGERASYRYPGKFEVRIGGRWSSPSEPQSWHGDGTEHVTTIDGHVDVTTGRPPATSFEHTTGATPEPKWHEGSTPPKPKRAGNLPAGSELESLRPVPKLPETAAKLLDSPRWSRWREVLSRPFTGSRPANVDEHRSSQNVREAGKPDERTAALDALETFTGIDARMARFERAALYHDSVRLQTDNTGGLFGSRDISARLDLSTTLGEPRIVGRDDQHTFKDEGYTSSEHGQGQQSSTTGKVSVGGGTFRPAQPWLSVGPQAQVSAGKGKGSGADTATGAKGTQGGSHVERGYLVSFDTTHELRGSVKHTWQDVLGLRHRDGSGQRNGWVTVPDGARVWVPASEIHHIGKLADEDLSKLDPADAEHYRKHQEPQPEPQPEPERTPPPRAPENVGRGSGTVDLYRPEAVKEFLDQVEHHFQDWVGEHGSAHNVTERGRSKFSELNDTFVHHVLGAFADRQSFKGLVREMLNGGRPVFLHGDTPFGKVEQMVVLRASLDEGQFHRHLSTADTKDALEGTGSTVNKATSSKQAGASVTFGSAMGTRGNPGGMQILGPTATYKSERGIESGVVETTKTTSSGKGPQVQYLHGLTVHMDVYPYARPGTYTKLLPGADGWAGPKVSEPWTASFDLPGAVRSTVPLSETIPAHEQITPPVETAPGSWHTDQRAKGGPLGFSPDAKVHVRPFAAPKLHQALDRLIRGGDGEKPRPGLHPQEGHRLRNAQSLQQRRTHLKDAVAGGHEITFDRGPLSKVKVTADLTRRELLGPVKDGALETKGDTTRTTKSTSERKLTAGFTGSVDFRAPNIDQTSPRPTAGVVEATRTPWNAGSKLTNKIESKQEVPESKAETYLVRAVPRWHVTPTYRGKHVPEEWNTLLRTGPDEPVLLEVDRQGLEDLGLHVPAEHHGPLSRPEEPREQAVGRDDRVCKSDPVDVATGEMVLQQTDLTLPHGLVLDRTHVSSYRAGRWFGPSWSSTVDQRLEIGDGEAVYVAEDGRVLVYPLPTGDEPALPVEGPRWPLHLLPDGGYLLDRETQALVFTYLGAWVERRDASGVLRVEYDQAGAPASLTHSAGTTVTLHREGDRIVELKMGDVVVLRYGYDMRGRLIHVVNSSGLPVVFDYDDADRITGWQNRSGRWYRYVYDEDGRCVRTLGDGGYSDGAFAYDRNLTAYTDALGNVSYTERNDANQVVREIDPLGGQTVFRWDRYDRLLSRTDPLGRTTAFEYDDAGELTGIVRPDGSRVAVTEGEDGALELTADDGQRVWRGRYEGDPLRQPVGVAEAPADAELTGVPEHAPDVLGRTEHDQFGRPRSRTDAYGEVTWEWTVEGNLLSRGRPGGGRERWRYDADGNEVEYVDPMGRVSRTTYGMFGLPLTTTAPDGSVTTYTYDRELRLVSVTTAGGLQWRYDYDAAGRMVAQTDYDGRTTRYAYDAAGQLVQVLTPAGQTLRYEYDLLGNVVARHTPEGTTRYTYDPLGRLLTATAPDCALRIVRDERGDVLQQIVDDRIVTFAYHDEQRSVERRTPSGAVSLWHFGPDGEPAMLATGSHVLGFSHDERGMETERRVDGVAVLGQAHDAAGAMTVQDVYGPETFTRREFEYFADGRLAAVRDDELGPTEFQLDRTGRVAEVRGPGGAESYRYDDLGNVTFAGYQNFADQRRFAGTALLGKFTYDACGRVVERVEGGRRWRYTWNSLDQLTTVDTPDGQRWHYRYDPLGRRIAKQRIAEGRVAEQILFTWDGPTLVEAELRLPDGTRRVRTWDYHPDTGKPVAQRESADEERFRVVVTDLVGTPVLLTDEAGRITWRSRETLWGVPVAAPGAEDIPLRFPGQYHDPESGLRYNVFRYYDPSTARYLSPDPLGLDPAPNPVAYVANPLHELDPLGLSAPCGDRGRRSRRQAPPLSSQAAFNMINSGSRHRTRSVSVDRGRSSSPPSLTRSGSYRERTPLRVDNWRVSPAPDPLPPAPPPRTSYPIGTYGAKDREAEYLSQKYGGQLSGGADAFKGGKHFQSEHIVTNQALIGHGGDKRGAAGDASRIENRGRAYFERTSAHAAHIGTGTKGEAKGKPIYGASGKDYRAHQQEFLRRNDFSTASQVTSLGYAYTPTYQRSRGLTPEGIAADESFVRSLDNPNPIEWIDDSGRLAFVPPPGPKGKAEQFLAREAMRTGRHPSPGRSMEIYDYYLDKDRGLPVGDPPVIRTKATYKSSYDPSYYEEGEPSDGGRRLQRSSRAGTPRELYERDASLPFRPSPSPQPNYEVRESRSGGSGRHGKKRSQF
ncbi:DUF6531 domain-containing protein [Amycolatopsis sacchari]|uniref:DUF6531 domain-containing protein n=1 Tax=Amycolatopsis sacchari TaxID=115433 RepID=UPI003D70FD23